MTLGALGAFGALPALVGEEVGFTEIDGFDEGFILGLILGCDDGFFEGFAEADGFNEGLKVGCDEAEGIRVGLFDGFTEIDGSILGAEETQSSAQKGPLLASVGESLKVQLVSPKIFVALL